MASIYDFSVNTIGGKETALADYKGKTLLIVNTASKCGFTPQFEGLEALFQKYKDKGLVILGFPCNQFKEQDPGSNEEIASFCQLNYGVSFPMFEKIEVNGPNAHPLYVYLKEQKTFAGLDAKHPLFDKLIEIFHKFDANYENNSDIKWNFTKFLVDKEGVVQSRFEPTATPEEIDGILANSL